MTADKITKKEFIKKWSVVYRQPEGFTTEQRRQECLYDLNALIREELIKYSAWGFGTNVNNKSIIEDVDEYLKSQQ